MKKLYIKTFGCQMNEYDSAKMADVLHASQGMNHTDVIEEADVILLNTCSIREKAQEKVFSDLGRLRELKQNNVCFFDHIGIAHTLGCIEHIGHFFRIVLVHLTTKCLDIKLFHVPFSDL